MVSQVLSLLLFVIAGGAGLVAISFLVEALRRVPPAPERLRWAPEIPIRYSQIDGHRLRWVKAGQGPALVLLHTLRTQLDLFEKVLPELSRSFTVYALDYPGHGYSDIPDARYDAAFFAGAVEAFLDDQDLHDVTLAGVSIGGSISLILAARNNPRLSRVAAINPYDYAAGRGIARSTWIGPMLFAALDIPIVGETVMRLRSMPIIRAVLEGGVADPASIPPALLREIYLAGNRRRHYRAFISLMRNSASWEEATAAYAGITIPVLLVWGDQDWATPTEREHDRRIIPGAEMVSLERGGHFLPLDRPDEVMKHLQKFSMESLRR